MPAWPGTKREATHGERAAHLLKRLRTAAHPDTPGPSASGAGAAGPADDDDATVPIPRLIYALHTLAGVTVVDAMHAVQQLVQHKCNTRTRLRRMSAPELQHVGVKGSAAVHDRIVHVLQTLGHAGADAEAAGLTAAERLGKQHKMHEESQLRREWGNTPSRTDDGRGGDDTFAFHAVTDEGALRGRSVVVNRAPVMTAWCVVVLQTLGFSVSEALSLAQCYVSTTANARARTLGRSYGEDVAAETSENQPHLVLMGVKLPVICLRDGAYRGLYAGAVVPPEQAFNYLRKSMFQMLPHVMGALTLLASSYADSDAGGRGADALHQVAYGLYAEFRPDTHGEWGKRATLHLDNILALRRGMAGVGGKEEGGPRKKEERFGKEETDGSHVMEKGERAGEEEPGDKEAMVGGDLEKGGAENKGEGERKGEGRGEEQQEDTDAEPGEHTRGEGGEGEKEGGATAKGAEDDDGPWGQRDVDDQSAHAPSNGDAGSTCRPLKAEPDPA
ncbi:hypothetical protein MSPP1_001183 [Malassezia sp. CBS 17886]|nr:hypothetical protein MSPP1_001183 [Malassezia sp. CBS 17886]